LNPKYAKVDLLKKELLSFEMSQKDKNRLDEKFRLEFNYNSNHLEGNTITYQDTKALLLKDIVSGSTYTYRELEEMKAHDVAFEVIKDWALDFTRELTQGDIRELNRLILVKDFWKDAQTNDGQPSRKLIKVGEYKDTPNSVRLQNGEVFHYADPIEVPAKMKDLLDWYTSNNSIMHPLELATEFHHKFVLIHPFDDGNGRISRLLMNYIFIRNRFPPVVIKSIDKQKYLNALRLADIGKMDEFVDFVADQLMWSLEISLKAAKGESIDEKGDFKKKLDLLTKKNEKISDLSGKYSIEAVDNLMNGSIKYLFTELEKVLSEFDKFYNSRQVNYSYGTSYKIKESLLDILETYKFNRNLFTLNTTIYFYISLNNPVATNGVTSQIVSENIKIVFFINRVQIVSESGHLIVYFTYNDGLSIGDIETVVEYIGNDLISKIHDDNAL
jgi:Fic family protein